MNLQFIDRNKRGTKAYHESRPITCVCFPVRFIVLMKLENIVRFSKEEKLCRYKYIDLTVEAYKEYFEISFFR